MGISKDLLEFLDLEDNEGLVNLDLLKEKEYDDMHDWDDYDYDYDGYSYLEDMSSYSLNKCPSCKRAYNIIHFECGEYIDKCICPNDEKDTVYYCSPCDVIWDTSTGEFIEGFSEESYDELSLFDDDTPYESDDPWSPQMQSILNNETSPVATTGTSKGKWGVYHEKNKGVTTTTNTNYNYNYNYKTCTHKHHEVKLFDGTPIYCSAVRDKGPEGIKNPDFGLYADSSWRPLWRNEFITWPDYNIPTNEEMGLTQIFEAYQRAKNGEMVEIGCIGGHGRTGTILAIMYIASAEGAIDGKQAYDFVKQNYCSHAIESSIQEWYIKYASAYWYGTEMPEKPKPAETGGKLCQMTDHFAMILRGHHKCANKGASCHYWKQDLAVYEKPDEQKTQTDIDNFYKALDKAKDYDYVYGGLIRYTDDAQTNGCSPLDHYVMITTGHEECIRLPGECTFWKSDVKDWNETQTINGDKEWDNVDESQVYKDLVELYPTVEEYKVLKEFNSLPTNKAIFLAPESEGKK